MKTEILNVLWLALAFLALFGLAELVYAVFKPKAEYTRKLVHFGTGIITLLFPVYLQSPWSVLFLCGCFAVILVFSLKYNLLKSINNIDRKSHGSISYPVSVFACFLFYYFMSKQYSAFEGKYLFFYLPILILAICDPVAALTGRRWPLRKFRVGDGYKSLMGTSAFLISSIALSSFLFSFFMAGDNLMPAIILSSVCISIPATAAEAFSPKGLDNLSIPLSVILGFFFSAKFVLPVFISQ